MNTAIKIAIWFMTTMYVISLGLDMVSAPSTIENIIGFFMVIAMALLSIKTRCFTIKLKKEK